MSLLKYRHWQYWLLLSLLRALWCLHHYIEHMIFYFYDSKSKLSAICHKIKQIQGISSNFSLAKFISFSEIIFYYILFCDILSLEIVCACQPCLFRFTRRWSYEYLRSFTAYDRIRDPHIDHYHGLQKITILRPWKKADI